jgi:hypothetical protein
MHLAALFDLYYCESLYQILILILHTMCNQLVMLDQIRTSAKYWHKEPISDFLCDPGTFLLLPAAPF